MRDQAVRVVARVVARPGKEGELRALLGADPLIWLQPVARSGR